MNAALTAERCLLGAALLYGRPALAAAGDLDPADLWHPLHRIVWRTVLALDAANKPIDASTVLEAMTAEHRQFRAEVGAKSDADAEPARLAGLILGWLAAMTADAVIPETARHHAQTVRDRATLQRLAEYGNAITLAAREPGADLGEVLANAESALVALALRGSGPQAVTMRDATRAAVKRIEARWEAKTAITGVVSGIPALDGVTAGWQPGHLIIGAGRPGMGKTSLVMSAALAAGVPALVFSLEMDQEELTERALATEGRIDSSVLRTGRLHRADWEKLTVGATRLYSAQIEIIDRPAMRLGEIRAAARRWRMRHPNGHGLIAVDYLQLVRADGKRRDGNREQEIAEISRSLKALARELRVPVIALAQLNRACEQRANRRPMLSDLRESGGIEQDADLVVFLYRDEVYTKDECKVPGTAEIIIGKNRHGATPTIPVKFAAESVRFDPMTGDEMRRYAEAMGGKS